MKMQKIALNASDSQSKRTCIARVIVFVVLIGLGLAGCSKNSDSSDSPQPATVQQVTPPPAPDNLPPLKAQQDAASAKTPIMHSILTAWQQGDASAAVSRFVETDWNARPLFSPDSTLSLSEDQFKSLPTADRKSKLDEALTQIGKMRELVRAVVRAGEDAAAKQDYAQARNYFTSLKKFGEALDSPDSLAILKSLGLALKKQADSELAKIGKTTP